MAWRYQGHMCVYLSAGRALAPPPWLADGVAFLLIALNMQAPLALVSLVSAQDGVDKLPVLNWPVPREWLNVQAGCGRATSTSSGTAAAAVGDGVADDTAAIQM